LEEVIDLEFLDNWLWFLAVVIGLALILLELIVGVQAGLDFVIIGSVCIIAGLITWPFHFWPVTIAAIIVVCLAYLVLGRRYMRKRYIKDSYRTNIDSIIDREGIVLKGIGRNTDGLVKVGNEQWRARAEEEIGEGETIVVVDIRGVTLHVKKKKGV
jgi:membrane protein implicated in regulation of membrane protease activity